MLKRHFHLLFLFFLFSAACRQTPPAPAVETQKPVWVSPDEAYGSLFADVQMAGIFPDGKTFPDCTPLFSPAEIKATYEEEKRTEGFDLNTFLQGHFIVPEVHTSGFKSDPSRPVQAHIEALWPVLTRQPGSSENQGTLIPLPYPYIVPGGRFGEIYYWDSYFTMLGLQASGNTDMLENMLDNFAYLIETVGFIPNGNRTYFLSRSQPPFFSLMVGLVADEKGESVWAKYLPSLEKEYAFWMEGADGLNDTQSSHRRVVRLSDGTILNRYWDDRAAPRPEAYRSDVETAKASGRPYPEIYTNIRAACESGWDFSSRWFADGQHLTTIQTAQILPVDLNCLLYNLEKSLATAYGVAGKKADSERMQEKARQRAAAIQALFYDKNAGFFFDYHIPSGQRLQVYTMAAAYPLFFQVATSEQADAVANALEARLLKPGGFVTTENHTGQQWDAPNGWAPLQWIGIQGLTNYGKTDLATRAKDAWVKLNVAVYQRTGKLVEKYNVEDLSLEAGGGEYPVQDGFGWTNGVLLRLMGM
ncbi:MAG: alpha,alpha-trehalase TreF [Saprospirales bacterium]|nr:alpha,alpha-trehalase TreF [Saprospirales bacterium]